MNRNWGYHATDRDFKPASMLIHKLVECVSKGGNFLLNVGPDPNGNLPEASVKVLGEIGRWMKFNSDSVYGCGPSGIEKPDWGRITRKGNELYLHIFENTLGPLPLTGIDPEQLDSIRMLATGCEVPVSTSWVHSDYPELAFADLGPSPILPDNVDTVLRVTLKP